MTSIPTTQLSAVYKPGHTDLTLEKKHAVPQPGKGEVLLKVAAAGVCHSDVELLTGLTLDKRTYTMGHEVSAVAVKLGEGVQNVQLGKLYAILNLTGGCMRGMVKPGPAAPAVLDIVGIGIDGGYAEFLVVPEAMCIPVPDKVSIEDAAIASDAGITAYHAVTNAAQINANSVKGKKVLIFGVGGLGHLAVQYVIHFGAEVYVCDNRPEARKLAKDLGATEAFDLIQLTDKTSSEDGFTVDVTIDFVVNNQTFLLAFAALQRNANKFEANTNRLVLVGVSDDILGVSVLNSIASEISVVTSLYGTQQDLEDVLDLFASGDVKGVVRSETLSNVNGVLDELRSGNIVGRVVVKPDSDN